MTRTKEKIKQVFLKMLESRLLSEISVIDITRECGVNRNTFYYYFRDIQALVDEIMMECINEIIAKYPSPSSFEDCLYAISEFVKQNRTIFLHIYRSLPRTTFEKYLWKLCGYFVDSYWRAASVDMDIGERDNALIRDFFVCAMFGLAINWVNNGITTKRYHQDIHRLMELLRINIKTTP